MSTQLRAVSVLLSLLPLCGVTVALGQESPAPPQQERATVVKPIQDVLKEHADKLLTIPGVVGTGEGLCGGQPCIKIFVEQATPDVLAKIPPVLDGYPVEVQETGPVRALPQ